MKRFTLLLLAILLIQSAFSQDEELNRTITVGFGPAFSFNPNSKIDTVNILNQLDPGLSLEVGFEFHLQNNMKIIFSFNGFDTALDTITVWNSMFEPIDESQFFVTNSNQELGFLNSLQFSAGISKSFKINEKLRVEPLVSIGLNMSKFVANQSVTIKEKGSNYWIEKSILNDSRFTNYRIYKGGISFRYQIIKINGTYLGLNVNTAYFSTRSKAVLLSESVDVFGESISNKKSFERQHDGILLNIGAYWNF